MAIIKPCCDIYHQVLQTGAELTELDSSGFATQAPTVFAGNLGEGEYIVQVGMGGGGVHGTGRYWGAGEYIIVTCQCLSFCVCAGDMYRYPTAKGR